MNITFLGPYGATFSHDAYNVLSKEHNAPSVNEESYSLARSNGEILKKIVEHSGYGAIAMETLAQGRVSEPLESFISLLQNFDDASCPLHIIGATEMRINFCLMAKVNQNIETLEGIIAHPRSLGACKEKIAALNIPTVQIGSNGEAARLVKESREYANYASLGPRSASEKYGLKILNSSYEDKIAITTFFLIGPRSHSISLGNVNRALVVFTTQHQPGSLAKILTLFAEKDLNLNQIHSMHTKNRDYSFAIEVEISDNQTSSFAEVMQKMKSLVKKHICFGPFELS